jgi:hypothetical protein
MADVSRELHIQGEVAKALLLNIRTEIGDDEDLALTAVEGETNLIEAITEALNRVLDIEAMEEAINLQQKALSQRKDRLSHQAERIRAAILLAMSSADLKKLELPRATLTRKATPAKVIVTNEAYLPSAFVIEKTELKPDKKALLEALKAGEVIAGAELSNGGEQLQIRGG